MKAELEGQQALELDLPEPTHTHAEGEWRWFCETCNPIISEAGERQ